MNPCSYPKVSLSCSVISASTTAPKFVVLHEADAVSGSQFLQWNIICHNNRTFFAPSSLECIQKYTRRSSCWKCVVTFKPGRKSALFKECVPGSKFGWVLLRQQVWICKHLTQIQWGKKEPLDDPCHLLPPLQNKQTGMVRFSKNVETNYISYKSQYCFRSENSNIASKACRVYIYKIKHLARPCWCVHWAPSPLLFYILWCFCWDSLIYWLFPFCSAACSSSLRSEGWPY